MITGSPFKAAFYEGNLRSIKADGVSYVMSQFFSGIDRKKHGSSNVIPINRNTVETPIEAVNEDGENADVCEEELLNAFHS